MSRIDAIGKAMHLEQITPSESYELMAMEAWLKKTPSAYVASLLFLAYDSIGREWEREVSDESYEAFKKRHQP